MIFVNGDFDATSGKSWVIMHHMGMNFKGTALVHPEDKQYQSAYTGCALAEIRATIKALKYELKILKKEIKLLRTFINGCTSSKKFDPKSDSAKVVFRQYNRRSKRYYDIIEDILDLRDQENRLIEARSKYIELRKTGGNKAKQINL